MQEDILEEIKAVSFEAANSAKEVSLKYFRSNLLSDNKDKDGWDPVTIADKETEKSIINVIKKYFPDHGIIGEETGDHNNNSPYKWIIDPIDGTRAFILGLPVWGTLIGVTFKDKPVFGLMSQPFINEIFYGDNVSSFHKKDDKISRLKSSDKTDISSSYIVCTTPDMFNDSETISKFNSIKQLCRDTRYGTDCYGFISVASGYADILFETGLSIYDYAPLLPIIKGSGGTYEILDKVKGTILVSSNDALHNKAMDIILNPQL